MKNHYSLSWGGLPPTAPVKGAEHFSLTVGNCRSYGDVCRLMGGNINSKVAHNRFLAWDSETKVVRVEAGMTIGELCAWGVARGVFPFVVPGTQFATVGGCIANDVHGKNHHKVGSFGCYVNKLCLKREGVFWECSPTDNTELFYATIGGLGLTGTIEWVDIRLQNSANPYFRVENHRFNSWEEFFSLDELFGEKASYTVSWIDCAMPYANALGFQTKHEPKAINPNTIRGIYTMAEPASANFSADLIHPTKSSKAVTFPFTPPFSLVGRFSTRAFNSLYWHLPRPSGLHHQHYIPFLFPLDHILHWNRVYGVRGFYQYQCVLPLSSAPLALPLLINTIYEYGGGSPLVVLKRMGKHRSGGLLSFPREGYTLAIDFANRGEKTKALLQGLSTITKANGGVEYPAKDARMSVEDFHCFYPQAGALEALREKGRTSDFWLRMNPDFPLGVF